MVSSLCDFLASLACQALVPRITPYHKLVRPVISKMDPSSLSFPAVEDNKMAETENSIRCQIQELIRIVIGQVNKRLFLLF